MAKNICPKCGAQTTYTRVADGRGCVACENGVPLSERVKPEAETPFEMPSLEERVRALELAVDAIEEFNRQRS